MYEEYKISCGGNELAKVAWYYGLVENVSNEKVSIICPFHEDINPSMMLDFEHGGFFCFGCQEAGDALKFVQKMEAKKNKANDLQGCKKYFEILKSDKANRISLSQARKRPVSARQLYEEAHDYYYGLSTIDWRKKTRDEDIVRARAYMKKRGFTAKALNACGAKVNYNKSYGIIFPMLDNGRFKGWVCRTWVLEVEAKRKYLYNKGFRRRTTLVGDYEDEEVLFVVEGYMDRLKFIQYGVENVVALLGWHISDDQIKKIRESNVKTIVSALDNDTCGKKGTRYLRTIFPDQVIRFQYLKGIKDPGEMSEEQFQKMYERTLSLIK